MNRGKNLITTMMCSIITTYKDKGQLMNQKQALDDIVDAIASRHNDGEIVELLITIAALLNDLDSKRFSNASYHRLFKFKRLTVDVKYAKDGVF